jgi:hypothetical protein
MLLRWPTRHPFWTEAIDEAGIVPVVTSDRPGWRGRRRRFWYFLDGFRGRLRPLRLVGSWGDEFRAWAVIVHDAITLIDNIVAARYFCLDGPR